MAALFLRSLSFRAVETRDTSPFWNGWVSCAKAMVWVVFVLEVQKYGVTRAADQGYR